ncbi:MAG TPA: hypothetical protein VKU01_07080 [Bryobacteraceae bacterium]|nr:hypothetical protein [Bryobacteraceae bacterium]
MNGVVRRIGGVLLFGFAFVWSCPWDSSLREFLSARFWLPFAKNGANFERTHVRRISAPFAGMMNAEGDRPLAKLRAAYRQISQPQSGPFAEAGLREAVAAARSDASLTQREKEEVDLIDAKIDMRAGQPSAPGPLDTALKKLETFQRTAKTPEFRSEAGGWIARIHYLLGQQTTAGKMYLDELNRDVSNLSREALLNSLRLTYGYDGGPELLAHLEEYFDTPEHAAFAIQLATNPHWPDVTKPFMPSREPARTYARIRELLEQHRDLLRSTARPNHLALLAMRTALRMGDPAEARKIGDAVPVKDAIRTEPDFNWMLGSADFLSRDYEAAEGPLVALFRSSRATANEKAAAAYGLCGVYRKTGKTKEQLRYALWLHAPGSKGKEYLSYPSEIEDLSLYWAESGWDLGLLLDVEAPIEALKLFADENPNLPEIRLVRYALAVRLARENRYVEAAEIYDAIHAANRAARMRRLAQLYGETTRTDLSVEQVLEAKYKLAEYVSSNSDRLYFNDTLWGGMQHYALQARSEYRMTRAERDAQLKNERKLQDDQEERWRAYLILREVVQSAGKTELGRKAARLALDCLVKISERFGRETDLRKAETELVKWLRNDGASG